MNGKDSMSCAGLMGLTIAASRPSLAERQTARARGAMLAADPAFQSALKAVGQDARRASLHSDIYYLWSLERVCVALGLRTLDGFDWYAHGARILIELQQDDGGWPHGQWGRLPATCLALLFLRKANLAFEIDRVLRLPGSGNDLHVVKTSGPGSAESDGQAPDTADSTPSAQCASCCRDRGRGGRGRCACKCDRCQRAGVPADIGPVRGEATRRIVSARRGT